MLTGLGASWLIGHVHGFVHLQQLAVVGMFPSLVWTVMGTEVVRALWFPLGFLVFAVPIGTFLEPWLQVFTANFIELGLRFADVPVQRQGYVLSIPSGLWEVAPDCGGLRYVLPGMALAYLYAALLFRDGLRRAAILILSFVLLIVANGLRAYTIVLADHVGIASGADHRFYSYTIYGVTVLAMLWLGNVLRDAS